MITSKQRAWLRARANSLESECQIGKSVLSDTFLQGLDEMMTTHELVKVVVHKHVDADVRVLAGQVAEALQADLVQVIGRRFVLYRPSEKLMRKGQSLQLPG